MDLPNLFSTNPQKDKLFLGLIITDHSVQAVLWKIAQNNISIVKTSKIIEFPDDDKGIIKTDQALQALGELSENLNEVILGIESSWVTQTGIADHKKPFLKNLTEKLSLKPVGFVVLTEAITQTLVQSQKDLNSLLLFYTKEKISLSLIKRGILQKTESVGRSGDSVGDLVEGLSRFPQEKKGHLPTKIQLITVNIPHQDLYEEQQALLSQDWTANGFFSSTPNIEVLAENTIVESVINQGGLAVAKTQGIEIMPQNNNPAEKIVESDASEFSFKEVDPETADKAKKQPATQTAVPDQTANISTKPIQDKQFSFGIPINSQKLPHIDTPETAVPDKEEFKPTATAPKPKRKKRPSKTVKWIKSHKFFAFTGFASGLITLIVIAVVTLTVAAQAAITLTLQNQNLNKDISIVLDASINESDFEELILKSEIITKDFTSNQINETTGTKLIGEKAKGKVEIWNKTDSPKSFSAGTNFSTADGIRFTLDEDIEVASASTEVKSGEEVKTYGKKETTITAVKIGAEGNIEGETSLTIDSFANSSYEAMTFGDSPLSGGSSREIRVVSEEDRSQLLSELKKKILELADQEFKEDSDEATTYISTGDIEITETIYSHEVSDETKTFSLELAAEVSAISYQKKDLKPLADFVLADLVPENFELTDKEPQILSDVDNNATSSAITLSANLSTVARPIIDLEKIKQEIVGQQLESAQKTLTDKSEIKKAEISLTPKILETLWKKLPGKTEKIEITID